MTTIVRGSAALELTDQPTRSTTMDDAVTSGDALNSRLAEIDATIIELCKTRTRIWRQVQELRVAGGQTRTNLAAENAVFRRFREALGPHGANLARLLLRS